MGDIAHISAGLSLLMINDHHRHVMHPIAGQPPTMLPGQFLNPPLKIRIQRCGQ